MKEAPMRTNSLSLSLSLSFSLPLSLSRSLSLSLSLKNDANDLLIGNVLSDTVIKWMQLSTFWR